MSSMSNRPTATLCAAACIALTLGSAGTARAAGELNIFNWGDYTSPELIEKFEQAFDVDVTLTDYDSNDTALAKVRAGGHGFDMVVPSANYVPIWVSEGLLLEARPDEMENFEHVAERWVDVDWDPGRRYTVPWQWGLTGIVVDTSVYDGDINTSAIFLDPPEELVGRINVAPEMSDVMHASIKYMGGDWCTDDKELLRQVRDKLVEAKESWIAMDYGTIEKFASRDYAAAFYWNGAAMRSREKNPDVRFGYPKEGFPYFMDSVAILADARERRQRQGLHELHHAARARGDALELREVRQRHRGLGGVHGPRAAGRARAGRARGVRRRRRVPRGVPARGQRPVLAHLDRHQQVAVAKSRRDGLGHRLKRG